MLYIVYSVSSRSESSGTIKTVMASSSNVKVKELAMDGSCVTLENKSYSSEVEMGNWTLERSHGNSKSTFTFASDYVLKRGSKVNIWAYAFEDNKSGDDLVANRSSCKTWGLRNGVLLLKDQSGKEKASCTISG